MKQNKKEVAGFNDANAGCRNCTGIVLEGTEPFTYYECGRFTFFTYDPLTGKQGKRYSNCEANNKNGDCAGFEQIPPEPEKTVKNKPSFWQRILRKKSSQYEKGI